MMRKLLATSVALALSSPALAAAEPLTLGQLLEMGRWLQCVEDEGDDCGVQDRRWEKNGVAPTDRADHVLAFLEYQEVQAGNAARLVCYSDAEDSAPSANTPRERGEIVIPGALCSGPTCEATAACTAGDCDAGNEAPQLGCPGPNADPEAEPTCMWVPGRRPERCTDLVCDAEPTRDAASCADDDGNGVPFWIEEALGDGENGVGDVCNAQNVCEFDSQCDWRDAIGRGQCKPRDCGGTDCTAFHLEVVAKDDTEVVVHLHYDFSPVPARVLDLLVAFDAGALSYVDARPLGRLAAAGKELRTQFDSQQNLRLTVFSPSSVGPIPTGAIVEIVFLRTGPGAAEISLVPNGDALAPLQGDRSVHAHLGNTAELWGDAITLGPRDREAVKLRLWYDFEERDTPIGINRTPSPEVLCARWPSCANETDAVAKARLLARLAQLQRGVARYSQEIDGSARRGAYFDGSDDQLQFPVHFDEPLTAGDQSFSFSTWFYSEGNSRNERADTPQIIYAHNAVNERTRFGLVLEMQGKEAYKLSFFEGDFLAVTTLAEPTVLAEGIPVRTWHHVGFTLDARGQSVKLYFDGDAIGTHELGDNGAPVQCPQFRGGTDLLLHEEGDVLGGTRPERIYTSVRVNNLFQITRMDPTGLGREVIIGDGEFSYRQPDYQPLLDRVVYSSNATGNFEIWIADGDGRNQRQLTTGFGDSSQGVSARRPRWAPDGSGIVFESNVFDAGRQDNHPARVTHLYYIGYDALRNETNIELPAGGRADQLDYDALIASGGLRSFRITANSPERHHSNAIWMEGRNPTTGDRGRLVADSAAPGFSGWQIRDVGIAANIPDSSSEAALGLDSAGGETRVLAAHRSVRAAFPENIVTERLFYEVDRATAVSANGFTATVVEDNINEIRVSVTHTPNIMDPDTCWDRNGNGAQDTDEDRDGDGDWDEVDCYPSEIIGLMLEFDPDLVDAVLTDEDGNFQTPGANLGNLGKELRLSTSFLGARAFARMDIASPLTIQPMPSGEELAVITFRRKRTGDPAVPFTLWRRNIDEELYTKDRIAATDPVRFNTLGRFERLEEADFSPDGDGLLMSVISQARPVLLRTSDIVDATSAERVTQTSARLSGLDWSREQRLYNCHQASGYKHFRTKRNLSGLRGGLDDVKLHSGLRVPESFQSEAERGIERLQARGRWNTAVDSLQPSCRGSHADCPPFHLCLLKANPPVSNDAADLYECRLQPCNPNDAQACGDTGGRCTLRPGTVEVQAPRGDPNAFDWVCATDCDADAQCFTEACLNGPCRFCDGTSLSCVECRDSVVQLGALRIASTDGCPDQRSFFCDAGSCISECFAFQDGQTVSLCDPATQFCDRGRCRLRDWSWWDFSPSSLVGLGEMQREITVGPSSAFTGYTKAIDQRIPIIINAYGVEDYGMSPEFVVEVRGDVMGDSWQRIGRVAVHNRTDTDADLKPYVMTSPLPFTNLRLRLINPPYNNVTASATGLGANDGNFCLGDAAANSADQAPCFRRPPGSQPMLGTPLDIPMHEAIKACREHGAPGCPVLDLRTKTNFLRGGSPAVIIKRVEMNGSAGFNNSSVNRICTYDGGPEPPFGVQTKLFFGDVELEQSNERDRYCAQDPTPAECTSGSMLARWSAANEGYAVLNCNYVDPADSTEVAGLEMVLIDVPEPVQRQGAIFENAQGCFVELDALRRETCIEATGGDVSIDANAALINVGATAALGTVDLSVPRSFGHSEGYISIPLPERTVTAVISGYEGGGLELANGLFDSVDVTAAPAPEIRVAFPRPVKKGRRYDVRVLTQPTRDRHRCRVGDDAAGRIADANIEVPVTCATGYVVGGNVGGNVRGELVLELAWGQKDAERISLREIGDFTFASALPNGTGYEVRVIRSPARQSCTVTAGGSGTIAGDDISNVAVNCADAEQRSLGLQVSGIAADSGGVQLLERRTRTPLRVTSNGGTSFNVDAALGFYAGQEFDVVITQQPTSPRQACSLENNRGVFEDADATVTLTCVDLPRTQVSATVYALAGEGLQVKLNNGDAVTVAAPDELGDDVVVNFPDGVTEGDNYVVSVVTNPTRPAQSCAVTNGSGAIVNGELDGGPIGIICQNVVGGDTFTLGGSVVGLNGSGLRIAVNPGAVGQALTENGAFEFDQPVTDNFAYNVVVERQPGSPVQLCVVVNGSGRVNAADVTNVQILCRDAGSVIVNMTGLGHAEGSEVSAALYSSGSGTTALVGVAPVTQVVRGGRSSFTVKVAGVTVRPGEELPDLGLPGGTYRLYVYVNLDGSQSTIGTGPVRTTRTPGDLGAVVANVVVNEGRERRLDIGSYTTLSRGRLAITKTLPAPAVSNDNPVLCHWAPPGSGRLQLPVNPNRSPVIATTTQCATAASGSCSDDQELSEPIDDPFITGVAYDVTCWHDIGGDGDYDSGTDSSGFASGVRPGGAITLP